MRSYSVNIDQLAELQQWLAHLVDPPASRDGYVGRIPPDTQRKVLERLGVDLDSCKNYNIVQGWFPTQTPIDIHSDASPWSGQVQRSLIIPIKNCEQLTWMWYKSLDDSAIYQQASPGQYNKVPMLPAKAAEVVESRLCDQPFVADINTWHSLQNARVVPAQLISIRILPWATTPWDQEPSLPPLGASVISF